MNNSYGITLGCISYYTVTVGVLFPKEYTPCVKDTDPYDVSINPGQGEHRSKGSTQKSTSTQCHVLVSNTTLS